MGTTTASLPLWVKQYLQHHITGNQEFPDDFWSLVKRPYKAGDCWRWGGTVHKRDQSPTYDSKSARVMAYLGLIGPIAQGHVLRSVCGNRTCINPVHMEIHSLTGNFTRRIR